ncbi:MAG: regulatory iron-sulfur-containing complex subunit RicT [bacterium]|nr:regulatory iron-sulfur-containing complex subunit RicT [bacterium]
MIKRVAGVQFNPWDQVYHFDPQDIKLKIGDKVIVKTENAMELGDVVSVTEIDPDNLDGPMITIIRKANHDDVKKIETLTSKKKDIMSQTKTLVDQSGLDMKIVDCYFSFDGGKIIFVFTAEGRVDFRDLVKNMSRQFQKSIRLEQIGIRDEARRLGGMGACGRELCCKKFLKNLTSVSTEYARLQQVHSRGSDRISGACGRLMCCLSYELNYYKEETKKFPKINSVIKTRQGDGKVVSFNVPKGTVGVLIKDNIIEVPLKEVIKK